MQSKGLAGCCLVLALAALPGCAGPPPPPPQGVVAPAPAAAPPPSASPTPVALVPPPAAAVRAPVMRHRVVAVVHPVTHRHWAPKHYAARAAYPPPGSLQCGSDVHPCSVEHIVVPLD